jgi:RNA polymerase sigma factor (sigma-70 family)
MKEPREIKPESFNALLKLLEPYEQKSGVAYEQLRQRLIRLFTCRGCSAPEELTDETIDRVVNSVSKPEFYFRGDPALYFYGVARNVHLEWLRRQRRYSIESIEDKTIVDSRGSDHGSADIERQHACLDRCLEKLPTEKRALLLRYYRYDHGGKIDHRRTLAKQIGLGLNAMRIQIYRLRSSVGECITQCLETTETDLDNSHLLE